MRSLWDLKVMNTFLLEEVEIHSALMSMPPFAPLFALLVALFIVFLWYQFKVEILSKAGSLLIANMASRVSFGSLERFFEWLQRLLYLSNSGMYSSS